ncbi:unnamed protein product [Mortierella alpina]
MANAPHKSGFFFAQQFDFYGLQHGGYTGRQPRPDSEGKSRVHAAFSSFENGTTTDHKNYTYGADGGPGVSCKTDIDGDYSHTYNLVLESTKVLAWNGDKHTCHSLPFTEVTIYDPTSKTVGVSGGKVMNVQEYGDCVNKAGYSAKQLPRAYDINVGSPENACRERR